MLVTIDNDADSGNVPGTKRVTGEEGWTKIKACQLDSKSSRALKVLEIKFIGFYMFDSLTRRIWMLKRESRWSYMKWKWPTPMYLLDLMLSKEDQFSQIGIRMLKDFRMYINVSIFLPPWIKTNIYHNIWIKT